MIFPVHIVSILSLLDRGGYIRHRCCRMEANSALSPNWTEESDLDDDPYGCRSESHGWDHLNPPLLTIRREGRVSMNSAKAVREGGENRWTSQKRKRPPTQPTISRRVSEEAGATNSEDVNFDEEGLLSELVVRYYPTRRSEQLVPPMEWLIQELHHVVSFRNVSQEERIHAMTMRLGNGGSNQ